MSQNNAGGVAGVGEHDCAGVFVDKSLELFAESIAITAFGGGGQGANGAACTLDECVVVGVEGFRYDNLAAVVKNAEHQHLQRFAAAGGDKDIALFIVNAEFIVIVLNGFDKHGQTGGRSVFKDGKLKIANRFEICGRGCDIGLTDIQMINLFAVIGCCNGKRMEFTHGGKVACQSLLRDFHGRSLRKSFFEEEKAVKQQKRLLRCRSAEGVSSYDVIVAFFSGLCNNVCAEKRYI